MAEHKVPASVLESLTKGPSETKRTQVSNLQNYIQVLFGEGYHTFLQGSYRNHTAISDINDVDIVVVRKETYSGVFSPQPTDNSILWGTIFDEIEEILEGQERYAWSMERGDKCIKLKGAIAVDIVPAVQIKSDHLEDPIAIYSFRGGEKKSHPRIHTENGKSKHSNTNDQFKPTVRMFKNWKKNHFGDRDVVSSHKIEALVHSVPNDQFTTDPVANFLLGTVAILGRLEGTAPVIHSVCGKEDIVASWPLAMQTAVKSQLTSSLEKAYKAYKATSQTEAAGYWKEAFNV